MDRSNSEGDRRAWPKALACLVLLTLPSAILAVGAMVYSSGLLGAGAISTLLGAVLFARNPQVWRPPVSASVIVLYIIALGWLWFATRSESDAFARVSRGTLILIALGLFIGHDLIRTGVEPRRRAKKFCRRIASCIRWPDRLEDIADLPDVRRLAREAHEDPSLAFDLLHDRRLEVQVAGLFALQKREYWRWEEGAVILDLAKKSQAPEVRILSAYALATAEHIDLVQGICEMLRDPKQEVRAAASAALLAGGETRWAMTRTSIRNYLADGNFDTDGPLPHSMGQLTPLAVCDLTGWTAESTPLCVRAIQTLLAHYNHELQSGSAPGLSSELGGQITDHQTPAVLRVELANLLRKHEALTQDLLDRMTDPDQPSAIRLLAVEILLDADPQDSAALDVLRGLGRQTNRDTAVAIARLLQKHLGLEFGVPAVGVPIPLKQSTEITQRVLRWATGKTSGFDDLPDDGPSMTEEPLSIPIGKGALRKIAPLMPAAPTPGLGLSKLKKGRPET